MNNFLVVTEPPEHFGYPVNPHNIVSCHATLQEAQAAHRDYCVEHCNPKAAAIRGPYPTQTEREAHEMLKAGMTMLNPTQLENRLDALGYRIRTTDSFNYYNTSNARHYKARSCYIVEKDSGLSFANIDARRDDNFKALQELRRTSFGYLNGRIWEI